MNALNRLFKVSSLVCFLALFFYGCGPNGKENETTESEASDSVNAQGGMVKTTKKAQNIFYAIPSPIELAQLIQKAGAKYNKDLLNDPNNLSKYSSNTSKALNLGIYGADLSYTSVFDDNTQESIIYLSCTRKMAESLGVGNAFDEKTVDRIQANSGKKDSIMTIITDSYMTTDEMLKESQRENASSLVISGGFIEALYLGTKLSASTKNNADIIARIAEQKGTLDNVVSLLSIYESDAGVAPVLNDMKAVKAIYEEVKVGSASSANVKTNPTTKVTTIGGKITYTISPETVQKLTLKITEIRNKIISGQN